jgi:endonuclease/exonuclease/phosphatase family metal-dependent hydrolase
MTTLGLLLFISLILIYFAALDFSLPFYREAIPPISALIFTIFFLGICLQSPRATTMTRTINEPAIFAGALVVFSLIHLVFNPPAPDPHPPSGAAVKIMTYNIHSAYDIHGRQDPEAIAKVILDSGAEIVAIQEISRGWLVNGSTDLTTWLSNRLRMQVVFKGTTGPMWGNAILSKYPILQVGFGKLPALDTHIERGYLRVEIDTGYDQPLNIFATHLHHEENAPIVRYAQLSELIHIWAKRPYSIILGDLNARPEDDEIELLMSAGLIDSWSESGIGRGYTVSSDKPFKRIDYIWHSEDLLGQNAEVPRSTASDHLPVIVTILPKSK